MCTKKEDWCYYSNAKHTSKGLYLPILTNERSSARMIGQAIAVPFLLFLFHTINRHLWFIDIGAPGSTPNHQPFMELPDQENKFPDILSWNLQTLVSWDRASYLVDSPFPPPRALAFRVSRNWLCKLTWSAAHARAEFEISQPHRNPLTCNFADLRSTSLVPVGKPHERYTLEERERPFRWGNRWIDLYYKIQLSINKKWIS